MENFTDKLDQYERGIGLPPYKPEVNLETDKYFNMHRNEIEKLSGDDCANGAYQLAMLALHVQRSLNREVAKKNWLTSELKKYVSDKVQQYSGSWEMQEYQVIRNDSYAEKLHTTKIETQLTVDRLYFIASSVRGMSDALNNIQRARNVKTG